MGGAYASNAPRCLRAWVRALDSRLRKVARSTHGRSAFKQQPWASCSHARASGHQAVYVGTGQGAVMPYGRERHVARSREKCDNVHLADRCFQATLSTPACSISRYRASQLTFLYTFLPIEQGPDLLNILRQSYDYLTIIPKLRSTYDGRLIHETSYEGRKAFLGYNSLAKSYLIV